MVKGKVVPVLEDMGEWRYSTTILDLDMRSNEVVGFTPRSIYPRRNDPRQLLDRRLGGFQSRYGQCEVQKHILPSQELNPGYQGRGPSL
jgi:hypothetical protein